MKPYSVDLRERIVAAVQEDQLSKTEVARRFKVSRRTVHRYLSLAAVAPLTPKKHPGREAKLKGELLDALRSHLAQHPDETLKEHAARFEREQGLSLGFSTVRRYGQRLGITRKKRPLPQENVTKQRVRPGSRM